MRLPFALVLVLVLVDAPIRAHAQEQQQEPTPFTTWIDFRQLAAGHAPTALPIWLAAVTTDHQAGPVGTLDCLDG